MKRIPFRLLMIAAMITGCTNMCEETREDMTPEQVVETYLEVALNMTTPEERDILMEYTTGNLKAAIESATPEQIRAAYVDRQYEIDGYSVVERRDRTPRETEITFQLTYRDLGSGEKKVKADEAATVTTENTVSVIKDEKVWRIREVMGNKTSIDFPISDASRITAKP